MNAITAFALFTSTRVSDDPDVEIPMWIALSSYVNIAVMCLFVVYVLHPMVDLFRSKRRHVSPNVQCL